MVGHPPEANKATRRLLRSTSIVSGLTLVSRVLGFLRDMIFAQVFGATPLFDAYIVAIRMPNVFRRMFAEGAFSQAFVPVLSAYQTQQGLAEQRDLIRYAVGTLMTVVLAVILVFEVLAPVMVMVFAPGFMADPVRFSLSTHLLRIVFPYLMLITLSACASAVLNSVGEFGIPAFVPIMLNVALITTALFIAPHAAAPMHVLAWGVLAGGVLQVLLQVPRLIQLRLLAWPRVSWRHPGVRQILRLMLPAVLGVSVAQISIFIDNIFASFLKAGSISWLYYSDRLTYLPVAVIGVAFATVVMPALSQHHQRKRHQDYSAIIDWALRWVLLIGLPAALGLFCLAGPILVTLFHYGAFTEFDVIQTRSSLMAFSIGIPGLIGVKVLATAFFSRQEMRVPVKVAIGAVLLNVVLNFLLIVPLKHAGLALATAIASSMNAASLLIMLRIKRYYEPQRQWFRYMLQVVGANLVMVGVLVSLMPTLGVWVNWSIGERVFYLVWLILLALLVYGAALFLLGVRWRQFRPPVSA